MLGTRPPDHEHEHQPFPFVRACSHPLAPSACADSAIVAKVGEALWRYSDMLYSLFDYYASLSERLDAITLSAWSAFVEDCRLASKRSKFCKLADLDRMFIEVRLCLIWPPERAPSDMARALATGHVPC